MSWFGKKEKKSKADAQVSVGKGVAGQPSGQSARGALPRLPGKQIGLPLAGGFSKVVKLEGATIDIVQGMSAVRLKLAVLSPIGEEPRVFVHLEQEGSMVGAAYAEPTASDVKWEPGKSIETVALIASKPSGPCTVLVGVTVGSGNERIPVQGSEDGRLSLGSVAFD